MRLELFALLGAVFVLLFAAGCTGSGNIGLQPQASVNNTYPAPVTSTQMKAFVEPYCSGKTGAELNNCTYTQAFNAKDVAVCTTLDALETRNTCITTWCGSAARDYKSCYRIADYDDQLLCLSKCNPNQMK